MIASEPLPHFVDDLLGYLYEAHPTHATLDGVHTHDDLLEDVSRHAIEGEAHALAGYLRRLDEIDREGLTAIEKLEHQMLTAHLLQLAGIDVLEVDVPDARRIIDEHRLRVGTGERQMAGIGAKEDQIRIGE